MKGKPIAEAHRDACGDADKYVYCKQTKATLVLVGCEKNKYGTMIKDEPKRLKELEKDSSRFKKMVADLLLDKEIIIVT